MFFFQDHPVQTEWKIITIFYDPFEEKSIARCIPWSGKSKDKECAESITRQALSVENLPEKNIRILPNFIFTAELVFAGSRYKELQLENPVNQYRFPVAEDSMIALLDGLNEGQLKHENGVLEGFFTFRYLRKKLFIHPYTGLSQNKPLD